MRAKTRKPDEVDRIFEGIDPLPSDVEWQELERRIRALIARREKRAFMHGFSRCVRAVDITHNNLVGSKYAWYCYRKETRRK